MPVVKLVSKLLLVALLLVALFMLLEQFIPSWVSTRVNYLIMVFCALTLLTSFGNLWAAGKGMLITVFIASQAIRMLLALGVIYIFIKFDPAEANAVVVDFFIVYLFFLIFEIITVLSNLRAEFRKPE